MSELYAKDFNLARPDVEMLDKSETLLILTNTGCSSCELYINELNKKNKPYKTIRCSEPQNKPFLLKLVKQLGLTSIQTPTVLKFKNGFLVNKLSNKISDI